MTFWCPMQFKWYPLDNQSCKFRLGSFAIDKTKMTFQTKKLFYDRTALYSVLDYSVDILPLDEKDGFYMWDDIGNFSLTGFEIRWKRHNMKYFINYYLPSGLFVIVSWVCSN